MGNAKDAERLTVTLTKEQKKYLDDLSKIGIHGRTAPEVVKTLVSREIERLISEGIIELHSKSTS